MGFLCLKKTGNATVELAAEGFAIKYRKIGYLLKELGFSLQQNQKMKQVGKQSPDRDKQFRRRCRSDERGQL